MEYDFEQLGLTEIIRLQNQLSEVLLRRFERTLALSFTDIVGSTEYFARFGDEAGRRLQQHHFDMLHAVLPIGDGRIVSTAGDGAFLCFPKATGGAEALIELHRRISLENESRPREHQMSIRAGLHWGKVLSDGVAVDGDSVNLAARITATAGPSEIRITRGAFFDLPGTLRTRCKILTPVKVKGFAAPIEVMTLDWREPGVFPAMVTIEETSEKIELPNRDTISFGRLREKDGVVANDIVLTVTDPQLAQQVSRWQFELCRRSDGFRLRQISDGLTEVDGKVVPKGGEALIRPGTVVRVVKLLTLRFLAAEKPTEAGGTVFPTG